MKTSITIAVILLFLYGLLLQLGPKPARLKLQSQWQENRYVVERYFHGVSKPTIVYTGSSLTKRLNFQESSCVYNLALDGGATLTGLNAVDVADARPKEIFVEINVPERGADPSLAEHAAGTLLRLSPVFYTENMPSNFVYGYLSGLRQRKPAIPSVNEAARVSELSRQQDSYKNPLGLTTLERSVADYRKVVSSLESKGITIVFFEMPVHPSLEGSPRATQIRATFRRAFPANQFLSFEDLSRGANIRTLDGLHLSPDEARQVVANMQHYRSC